MLRLIAVPMVCAGLFGLFALGSQDTAEGPLSLLCGLGFVGLCQVLLLLLTMERAPWPEPQCDDGLVMADKQVTH